MTEHNPETVKPMPGTMGSPEVLTGEAAAASALDAQVAQEEAIRAQETAAQAAEAAAAAQARVQALNSAQVDPSVAVINNKNTSRRKYGVAALAVGAVAVVAALGYGGYKFFGSSHKDNKKANTPGQTIASAKEACGVTPELNANRDNTVHGSEFAAFSNLSTKDGDLLPASQVSERMRYQLSHDKRTLASFMTYFVDPRAGNDTPNNQTINGIQTKLDTYKSHPKIMLGDLTKACEAVEPNLIHAHTDIPLATNTAVRVSANHKKNRLTGFSVDQLSAGSLKGYTFGVDHDSVSSTQAKVGDQWEKIFAVDAKGEEIVEEGLQHSSMALKGGNHRVHINSGGRVKENIGEGAGAKCGGCGGPAKCPKCVGTGGTPHTPPRKHQPVVAHPTTRQPIVTQPVPPEQPQPPVTPPPTCEQTNSCAPTPTCEEEDDCLKPVAPPIDTPGAHDPNTSHING